MDLLELFEKPLSGEWGTDSGNSIVPVLRTTNFQKNGKLNFENLVYRNIDIKKNEIKILRYGDTIIEKSGGSPKQPVGRVVFFDKKETKDMFFSNNFTAILRPKKNVHPKFAFYQLRYLYSRKEVIKFQNKTTGIINLKLNDYLKKTRISEFGYNVQQKIADILDLASLLIEKRKEQLEAMDQLIQSVFYEMFGDPVVNDKNWEMFNLSNLGELGRGVSKHRPRNDEKLLGGEYPLIQTGDIANSYIYIYDYKSTYSKLGLEQSKLWRKGTLCITIAANIAKTGILTFNSCFPDSVVGFIANEKTNSIFINVWFSFFQKIIENSAPESAQKNINLKILSNLSVIAPPIDLQNKFASIVEEIEAQKKVMEESLQEMENNFNALMQKAFKGELFPE